MLYTRRNCAIEWAYSSGKAYIDPFNDVELDVVVTDPDGQELTVPAFWAGDQTWRVRFAPRQIGQYTFRTVCSDAGNPDLHGQTGALMVARYNGDNPLLRHGFLRVAADRRHLEHADGTPFFWLADTWWMGFTQRLSWPADFQQLTADRVAKGFSAVQIVAGLYPDMDWYDERGMNEAGFPWARDFSQINPTYFDMADLRIAHLVRSGIVPCIVGEWGYFMDFAGKDVLKKHWRYIVARYSAYPVTWCAAGEAMMNYYLLKDPQRNTDEWKKGRQAEWSDLVRHIRALDPNKHPITIHPTQFGRQQVDDPAVLDFEMLQTGHSGFNSLANTLNSLEKSLAADPTLPVVIGEVNYEGIMESSREEIQRFIFWTSVLTGAMGHTYGANGIWQVNGREAPYGLSPHGSSWGNRPWDEAAALPGSSQLGIAKRLLERYPWQRFEPHPEWVEPHQEPEKRMLPYAAGVPGQVRVIYIPAEASWIAWRGALIVKGLETGATYHAFYFDPTNGAEYDLGNVAGGSDTVLPKTPVFQDWVLVLEKQ
jgi:hypothetical protein